MSYQMIIHLSDQEYALLAAEAAKSGKHPEMLLHDMIQHLQSDSQRKHRVTEDKLLERLYREGKVLNLPERQSLTSEERAEKEAFPIFVCADNNLLAIATAEGLSTENPNNYAF